jgi:predicted enzyme related to lactoylglutathione lyase
MPKLTVSDLRAFIPAQDFELSKRFYSSLGWTVKDVGDGLALVEAESVHFYIQNYYNKDVAENSMLHITVDDARAWHQHVAAVLEREKFGGARVQPPKPQPYGAVVTFVHDPTGVLLHLCQWKP